MKLYSKIIGIIACTIFLFLKSNAQIATIITVAGDSSSVFSGDGGPATNAGLLNPAAVAMAVDTSGNYYISDGGHSCLRKVSPSGGNIIFTIAGTPDMSGYSGDNGPATNARLFNPTSMAVDQMGNIAFYDSGNYCIRKIDIATGVITTIAGNHTMGSGFSGDGGPATLAQISDSIGICFDRLGNLYIADGGNSCLRKVSPSGGNIISTIAGVPRSPGFSGDDSLATNAQMNYPTAVAVDTSGNIYIADGGNSCLRKVSPSGGNIISTIAGIPHTPGFSGDSGPATAAKFDFPTGIAVSRRGSIFIADNGNNRMRYIGTDGNIYTAVGTGVGGFNGDGLCTAKEVNRPSGLCLDSLNNCYIADRANNRIRYVNYLLGVDQDKKAVAQLLITPNPAQGSFIIKYVSQMDEVATIEILDILGNVVYSSSIKSNSEQLIDLKGREGMFVVHGFAANNSFSTKIALTK